MGRGNSILKNYIFKKKCRYTSCYDSSMYRFCVVDVKITSVFRELLIKSEWATFPRWRPPCSACGFYSNISMLYVRRPEHSFVFRRTCMAGHCNIKSVSSVAIEIKTVRKCHKVERIEQNEIFGNMNGL